MEQTITNCVEATSCVFFFQVANAMVANWAGPPAMLAIFRKLFGSFSCPHIVRQNNFTNLQHYFLQKAKCFFFCMKYGYNLNHRNESKYGRHMRQVQAKPVRIAAVAGYMGQLLM